METIRLKIGHLHFTIKSNDTLYMEGVCKVCKDIFSNSTTVNNEQHNVLILINSHQPCNEFFIKSLNGINSLSKYRNVIFIVSKNDKSVLRGLLEARVGFIDINIDVEEFKKALHYYINTDKKITHIEKLTNIEKQIIFLIGTKNSKKQICCFLKMKDLTLNVHLCNIKKKLFVKTTSELIVKCDIYIYIASILYFYL